MVEKMANRLAERLVAECLIEQKQQESYAYTFQCMAEKTITVGTILALSIILKSFVPTIFFLIFFFALRTRTGGYHADTFIKCYFGTISLYCLVVIVCKYNIGNRMSWTVLLGISTVVILVLGTLNNPAVHMNRHEMQESRRSARITLVLEESVIAFLLVMRGEHINIKFMSAAVILCATLMCFAKILGQEEQNDEENKQTIIEVSGTGSKK